jgi:outer membrane protein TolC
MVPAHILAALALAGVVLPGCVTGLSGRYQALHRKLEHSQPEPVESRETEGIFAHVATLERPALLRAVLERNPTVRSAQQAWRAALARYPQVVSLDDPTLGYGIAPRSFGSSSVDDAYKIDLSQKLPFPGKLALRGQAALAEAEAAQRDFEAVRLRLATIASLLYDDYYFLARSVEINAEHIALLEDFRSIATARYESGQASQQDPLQAETEHAHLIHNDVVLRTAFRVMVQQLNALLHRPPELPLPPPPKTLSLQAAAAQEAGELVREALETRPELLAADARVTARQATVKHAQREFFPDFTLSGSYNKLWQADELQPFVGISINVPLGISRRRAALEEARARLAKAENERESVEDQVRFSVQSSGEHLAEARHVLQLFSERLLPPARDRIEAARAGFETGQNSFLVLIDAERNLRTVQLGLEEARTNLSRRSTELLQATGNLRALER